MHQSEYQQIISYILDSGKRLVSRTGNIADIGITKKDLTEEDLAIERGVAEIIKRFGNDHILFAEEEHDVFNESDHIWAVDPISGTANFIKGMPHYAIVVTHLFKKEPIFTAVYDPSVDELFTAKKGEGAYLNNRQISVSEGTSDKVSINFNYWWDWQDKNQANRMWTELLQFNTYRNKQSFAVNYCNIACGRYDGIVSFCKDTFPEFAGSLIIREAGGIFTNTNGESLFSSDDRIFIGGNKNTYQKLNEKVQHVLTTPNP